ncbi:LAFA_0B04324g1_1 [Lachancea sp. 'fantastica']|nr:LAFA_0B04324g1_1 [Lachancea sp. 'fantastica']
MDVSISQNLIKFSYFDPFDVFESIRKELEDRLPFKSLHWKPVNESLRTISSLPVGLVRETDEKSGSDCSKQPLILFLVINCTSIDDYRAKIRPLVRQWLPPSNGTGDEDSSHGMPVKRIALIHTNSSVSGSNIFKTFMFSEKFSKDFPFLTAIEIKTIYKSEKEKMDFWNGTLNRLRRYTMEVFEQRLAYLETQRSSIATGETGQLAAIQENILNLFLSFHLNDEASRELESLKHTLFQNMAAASPTGELEIPFQISPNDERARSNSFKMDLDNQKYSTTFGLNKFFFLKQCELIQSTHAQAARNARLYQLTKSFLKTIGRHFRGSPLLNNFKWSFVASLLESSIFDSAESHSYREIVADLKILQRDCWIDLAYASKGFKLLHRTYPAGGSKTQLESLNATFRDEETFHKSYFFATKEIITLLNGHNSKKYRTVDLLSVELGLLHYQREEYHMAISILHPCHEYYKGSSWNLLAYHLLECFIDCLIKCPEVETLAIGDENVPAPTVLSNSILDLLTSVKTDDLKSYWWDRFIEINEGCDGSLIYPLTNLFDFDIQGKLIVTRPNHFGLKVKITNDKIPKSVEVRKMQLRFKSSDDNILEFDLQDVTVKPGENAVFLECTRIYFGIVKIVSLTCTVGKTIFCQEFSPDDGRVTELERPIEARNFEIIAAPSNKFEIGKTSINLKYFNNERVEKFKLTLTAIEISSKAPLSFDKDGRQLSKEIEGFGISNVDLFGLPSGDFQLKQELAFKMSDYPDKDFYQRDVKDIKSTLPVSVSVEDIVLDGMFYFKFLINSSSPTEPILLHKSSLSSLRPEKYSISGGFIPKCSLLVKNGESDTCYSFFQVSTKPSERFASEDLFHLNVAFNTLKDQLDHLVTNAILIQGNPQLASKMESYRDTWNSMILTRLVYDYSLFESTFSLKLVSDESYVNDLNLLLNSRIHDVQFLEASTKCLQAIQKGFQFSRLEIDEYTKDLVPSMLLVPVTLPRLSHFFSVNLKCEKGPGLTLELGQVMSFSLSVKDAAVDWQTTSSKANNHILELFNSSEWLIDGKRRFSIEGESDAHTINMIPLRRGYLKYPKIEITENGRKISEVNYCNSNEVTLVL